MGLWSKFKKGVTAVGRTIKDAAKFSVDTFVAKPVGFATSWVPVTKKMRIQVFILRNEFGDSILNSADIQNLQDALSYAIRTFKEKFDIELKAYANPIIQTLNKPAPNTALDVACDTGAMKNELGSAGNYFESHLAGWNVIPISLAFPISVFIVREIKGKLGCSLGAATDYVTLSVQGTGSISTLAHELAHSCGLFHRNDIGNIMYHNSNRGNEVTYWQKTVVRSCRHVSFL